MDSCRHEDSKNNTRSVNTADGKDKQVGTVLITGASDGIGWELAHLFARNGHRPILVARREEKLARLAAILETDCNIQAEVVPCDLSHPDAARNLWEELQRRSLPVDILVNNAGFGARGFFAETDAGVTEQLLHVNVVALTCLTRQILPSMLARKAGRILNVASIAAWFPGPLTATYNASKAYVLSFSEALALELEGTGVTVTVLCPGPTRTGFEARAGLEGTLAFQGSVMDAAAVAQVGYTALMEGRRVAIPGFKNRLRMLPIHLMPRALVARFARKFHEKPES